MKHLNAEAGLFEVIRVSDLSVTASDGDSPVSNAIYFMLTKSEPQNYLHWLYSDDYQTLIEGGPADYYLFFADGSVAKYTMGRDLKNGQVLVVPCPANAAKAIVLHESASHLLVSSVVTPAWSPQRARIGADESFVDQYAGQADWATPEFLSFLVGPNFGHKIGAAATGLNLGIDSLGQIIWQGMQLTDAQALLEIKKFTGAHPDQEFEITFDDNQTASSTCAKRLADLAGQAGFSNVRLRQC